jgi:hypothetical protein
MLKETAKVKLQDGTRVRHKVVGYEGLIEGTTGIKACFTDVGELLNDRYGKQTFQYRVFLKGESMRRIAPDDDLEILELIEEVICPQCRFSFRTKPDFANKPGGRCTCGGWICPSCVYCQGGSGQPPCLNQRKRLMRKLTLRKKARQSVETGG